jgi:hypothetical protein
MSTQSSSQLNHKETTNDRAQEALGVSRPQVRGPRFRRFLRWPSQRAWRRRYQYRLERTVRPIQGFLVTHRRRFTTGNKHKQPYKG